MNDEKENKEKRELNDFYSMRSSSPPGNSLWKYLIAIFLGWIVISYFFNFMGGPKRITVAYSTFKNQVSAQNVKSITIKGNDIKGEFAHRYTPTDTSKNNSNYKYFATTKPSYYDPDLVKMLDKNNVTVNAKNDNTSWITYLLLMGLPWILILGYFIYARRKMQGQMGNMMQGGGLFGVGKSRAKRFVGTKTRTTFDDVAGLLNPKKDLREIIDFLKEPGKFTALGAEIPKGILLVGPPGTGKTLLARATAGEAGVTFFSISGSEFIEMFVGVGASRVRDMFETAKKEAPAVIFIDEIDSVGRARGAGLGGGHDEREQTLNQILSEMDGFEPNQSVVVMAATNRPDVLDPALTRPGRFDRQITLELPQKNARLKILEIHTKKVPLSDDVNLDNIASRTVTFSGADLKNLVNEAALLAGRKKKTKVDPIDFDEARDKILLGDEREELINEEEKKVIAYHEAGHALIAKLLPDTDPLQKVTIIPRGRALGVTEQVPDTDRHNMKKKYLLDRICVALGGRASEKIVFGDITTGAASDLKQVTKLARHMVCQWGMSDKVGPVMFRLGEEHLFLGREISQQKEFSESTARIIDEEIQRIVKEMEDKAERILKDNRTKLDALAEALIENETLENSQVDWILGKVAGSGSNGKSREREKAEEIV